MTRASLLHLLAHPAALTGPDVRALEELAQAFPYCQTAHLLLAKAAHDQGSMLAPQRLRPAATYAADRRRLRQLIETPAAVEVIVLEEAAVEAPAVSQPGLLAVADELPTPFSDLAPAAATTLPFALEQPTQLVDTAFTDAPDQLIGTAPTDVAITGDEIETPPAEAAEATPAPEPLPDTELPAQAPPIRPPAEAEAARFEFGLAEQEPAEIIAYRLPELAELPALASAAATPVTPRLPIFGGVDDVFYAPCEGSRLGFGLVAATATEAGLPGSQLPPTGEFFAPDALLLTHLALHQPPAPPKPSSPVDLINSFLQRAPVASRRRAMPTPAMPDADSQADLSVRSTRAEPDLVSENLAHILARQGKNDRAIAVYERLMVKHPERMAYFAAQIESLRPENKL